MFLQLPLLLITQEGQEEQPDPEQQAEAQKIQERDATANAKTAKEMLKDLATKINDSRLSRLTKGRMADHEARGAIHAPNAGVGGSPNQLRITGYVESKRKQDRATLSQVEKQQRILGLVTASKDDNNKDLSQLKNDMSNESSNNDKSKGNLLLDLAAPLIPKGIYGGSMLLPAPELQTTYNFAWEQDQNKAVAKLAEIGSFTDAIKNLGDGGAGTIGGLVAAMSKDNPDLITQTLYSNNRIAFNEPVQQYFKGLDVRTFSFSWKFIPREPAEWKIIKNLINRLKFLGHPEIMNAGNGKYYRYPAEFLLEYLVHDSRTGIFRVNSDLPLIGRCVLTNLDVNYSPNRLVTHEDGAPVEIDLSLSFTEMQKLDRRQFGQALDDPEVKGAAYNRPRSAPDATY